jgi:hypothetical protein
MNKKHHYVHVSKVSAGMILSENLLDKLGHVLLPAGTVLNEHVIKAMAHHDLNQIAILDDETQTSHEDANAAIALQEKRIARLSSIYRHAPLGEPTDTLQTYIEKYRRSAAS